MTGTAPHAWQHDTKISVGISVLGKRSSDGCTIQNNHNGHLVSLDERYFDKIYLM